jgi:hypothetical protein
MIIIMRGENFVAHLDGLGGTPVAHHSHTKYKYYKKSPSFCKYDLRFSRRRVSEVLAASIIVIRAERDLNPNITFLEQIFKCEPWSSGFFLREVV